MEQLFKMKLVVGKYFNHQIQLFTNENTKTHTDDNFDGILVSAKDCHIHTIPSKLKSDPQILSFIQHYLKTVHPGPYDNLIFDYLLSGKSESRKIILVIMENKILETYKSFGVPLYFFFQTNTTNNFSIQINDSFENYSFNKGILEEVTFGKLEKFQILTIDKFTIKKGKQLFQEKRKKEPIKPVPIILMLLFLFLTVLFLRSLSNYNDLKNTYEFNQQQIRKIVQSQQNSSNPNDDFSEIRNSVFSIKQSVPRNYYSILSQISSGISNQITVDSLKISDNTITISGKSPNALKMINELDSTGLFQELKPSKIYPSNKNMETFSITGVLK